MSKADGKSELWESTPVVILLYPVGPVLLCNRYSVPILLRNTSEGLSSSLKTLQPLTFPQPPCVLCFHEQLMCWLNRTETLPCFPILAAPGNVADRCFFPLINSMHIMSCSRMSTKSHISPSVGELGFHLSSEEKLGEVLSQPTSTRTAVLKLCVHIFICRISFSSTLTLSFKKALELIELWDLRIPPL